MASLNKGGYTAFYLPAGSHTMKQHWTGMTDERETVQFGFELKPGETRYCRLTIGIESFSPTFCYRAVGFAATHRWAVTQVARSVAMHDIVLTRYQPAADPASVERIGSK